MLPEVWNATWHRIGRLQTHVGISRTSLRRLGPPTGSTGPTAIALNKPFGKLTLAVDRFLGDRS